MKKIISMIVMSAMVVSMLAGCGSSTETASSTSTSEEATSDVASESASTEGAVVVVAKENDVISMDSMYATDGTSFEAIHATVDGLMDQDADGNLVLSLAESYEVSEDGLVYTFTLRDAVWSNGTAVTAHDFVYAWNAAATSVDCEYSYLFTTDGAAVANANEVIYDGEAGELGVVAIDDTTLEVTLSQPTPYFLSLMTFPVFYPVNQEFAEAQDGNYGLTPENLLACGPYVLTEWEKGSSLVFAKNESYWDAENVKVAGLEFAIVAEVATSVTAFEAGDVDFTKVSSDLIGLYADSEDYTTVLEGYLWYLQFNLNEEVAGNQNLRLAIAYALDKQDLCDNVLQDGSIVGQGFVPTLLATGPDGEDFRTTAGDFLVPDADTAATYWAAAQEELGEEITISLLYENADPALTSAEYLQSTLMAALPGLTIEMNMMTKEARIEAQKDREFEVVLTRWGPDYADPTTYLNLMLTGNSYNYGDYASEEFDSLMEAAGTAASDAERWDYLLQAEEVLMADAPVVSVFQVGGASLISSSVSGIETHAVGVPYIYKNLSVE
ncbi:MAG: peptide ABC transporter substrate-binding protein [Eubacteriales bacterium]